MHNARTQNDFTLRRSPWLADHLKGRIPFECPLRNRRLCCPSVAVRNQPCGLRHHDNIGVFVEYREFHSTTLSFSAAALARREFCENRIKLFFVEVWAKRVGEKKLAVCGLPE